MTVPEQIYLSAVTAAFIFFGITLFSIYVWSGMTPPDGKPVRKPIGILAGALIVSIVGAVAIGQLARDAAAPPPVQLTAAR